MTQTTSHSSSSSFLQPDGRCLLQFALFLWTFLIFHFISGSGDEEEEKKQTTWSSGGGALYMDEFLDFDAPFNCRLSLKDFDTLIHDLDRELAKQINICL